MKEDTNWGKLEAKLGYQFKRESLLKQALTHTSHFHEIGDSDHNEQLEFLGDSILNLIVGEALLKAHPDYNEGQLSKLRASLVSEKSLADLGKKIELGHFLRLGKGEDRSGGRSRDSVIADTVEAVIAAIYKDSSFAQVRKVVLDLFEEKLSHSVEKLPEADEKSWFQELCQKAGLGVPSYVCTKQPSSKDRQGQFEMTLILQGVELSKGLASTKKEASREAAKVFFTRENTSNLVSQLKKKIAHGKS